MNLQVRTVLCNQFSLNQFRIAHLVSTRTHTHTLCVYMTCIQSAWCLNGLHVFARTNVPVAVAAIKMQSSSVDVYACACLYDSELRAREREGEGQTKSNTARQTVNVQ